jgi:hypothetical protein
MEIDPGRGDFFCPRCAPLTARSRTGFIREDSERIRGHGNAWMALDVISIVIGWPVFGDIRSRGIGQLVSVMKRAGSAGSQRKRQTGKKALKIEEEFERAVKTKRTLRQVQRALDRLHEEFLANALFEPPFVTAKSHLVYRLPARCDSDVQVGHGKAMRRVVTAPSPTG